MVSRRRAFLADPRSAPVPFFWHLSPSPGFARLLQADAAHPLRLALVLAAPVALCALLTRNRSRVLEFSLTFAGIMLFAVLWHYVGGPRHYGLVFAALIACVWTARARAPQAASSWLLVGILAVNAFGGVASLGSEFTPFSQSRNAARWIEGQSTWPVCR